MTSFSLKLDRPQLQHWLLFLGNRPRSENSNVVAGLPVPIGCDCVYDPPVLSTFEWGRFQFEFLQNLNSAGSTSCRFDKSWLK